MGCPDWGSPSCVIVVVCVRSPCRLFDCGNSLSFTYKSYFGMRLVLQLHSRTPLRGFFVIFSSYVTIL